MKNLFLHNQLKSNGLGKTSPFSFDRLVRLEYACHRADWEQDGKPRGFFWVPSECRLFWSWLAQQRAAFVWLFQTPSWMREEQEALRWVSRLRILVCAWNIGIIVTAGIAFLFSRG